MRVGGMAAPSRRRAKAGEMLRLGPGLCQGCAAVRTVTRGVVTGVTNVCMNPVEMWMSEANRLQHCARVSGEPAVIHH